MFANRSSKILNKTKRLTVTTFKKAKLTTRTVNNVTLPAIDWDDWIKQYPSFARKKALEFKKHCENIETDCDFDPVQIDKIDWDYWRNTIKTPGIVEAIKAEFDATDNSDYGAYYFDHLTDKARNEILSDHSRHSEEAKSIGPDLIRKGVRTTLQNDIKQKIRSGAEMSEKSSLLLEELYKDLEQIDININRSYRRSKDEELAELPDFARETEENLAGGGFGNGYNTYPDDYSRENAMLLEQENRYDKECAENSLRAFDRSIDDYLQLLLKMGFQVEKEEYIDQKFAEWQKEINRLREYCKTTRSIESVDPETGKEMTQEKERLVKVPGGG
ncbi:hypothetical protein MHBO_003621 [Bonamia ostreae]|uniref:37S ribosomal protein S25, mitochondrial n=1 Tax=Bonamia ostreae TaxID=126728 RepID=A0ABV2ARM5_9EUKA